jgi:3-dehydroquinate synthase
MIDDLIVASTPPYPVRLRESFAEVWQAIREDQGERPWFVVADRRVLDRQPGALRGLRAAERRHLVALPGGERVKSMTRLQWLQRAALEFGVHRDSLVIAVGGGTIGDLAGLFAATWMRGVDWCPVSTTSLAMADSSIGGKTAVDLGGVKNLVGSFHQPVGVYGALEALASLHPRHRRAGLAEVVKAGIIRDETLFVLLESRGRELEDPRSALWWEVLAAANRVKAMVVAQDPREAGERAILNFGHTLGHALESVHRPPLLHGEAVSLGMIAACWIAEELRMAPSGTTDRVRELALALRLPRSVRTVDRARLWKVMSYDKKGCPGEARLVLTTGIGSATVGHVVGRKVLRASLGSLMPSDKQR